MMQYKFILLAIISMFSGQNKIHRLKVKNFLFVLSFLIIKICDVFRRGGGHRRRGRDDAPPPHPHSCGGNEEGGSAKGRSEQRAEEVS